MVLRIFEMVNGGANVKGKRNTIIGTILQLVKFASSALQSKSDSIRVWTLVFVCVYWKAWKVCYNVVTCVCVCVWPAQKQMYVN